MSSHFFQHINPERSSNAEMLLPGMQGDINKAAFEKISPSPPRTLDSHLISKLFSTTAALKDLCVTCMNWFFFCFGNEAAWGLFSTGWWWRTGCPDTLGFSRVLRPRLSCCRRSPRPRRSCDRHGSSGNERSDTLRQPETKKCGENNGKYLFLVGCILTSYYMQTVAALKAKTYVMGRNRIYNGR